MTDDKGMSKTTYQDVLGDEGAALYALFLKKQRVTVLERTQQFGGSWRSEFFDHLPAIPKLIDVVKNNIFSGRWKVVDEDLDAMLHALERQRLRNDWVESILIHVGQHQAEHEVSDECLIRCMCVCGSAESLEALLRKSCYSQDLLNRMLVFSSIQRKITHVNTLLHQGADAFAHESLACREAIEAHDPIMMAYWFERHPGLKSTLSKQIMCVALKQDRWGDFLTAKKDSLDWKSHLQDCLKAAIDSDSNAVFLSFCKLLNDEEMLEQVREYWVLRRLVQKKQWTVLEHMEVYLDIPAFEQLESIHDALKERDKSHFNERPGFLKHVKSNKRALKEKEALAQIVKKASENKAPQRNRRV